MPNPSSWTGSGGGGGGVVQQGARDATAQPWEVLARDSDDADLLADGSGRLTVAPASPGLATDALANATAARLPTSTGGEAEALNVFPYVYNGATWDRARGNALGGLFVQSPFGLYASGADFKTEVIDSAGNSIEVRTPSADAAAPLASLYTRAFPMVYNGATWDRARGDIANGLDVDVTRLPAVALDAATLAALETISVANFPAVQPVSDNGGSLTVDGPLTDAELRAAAVPVDLKEGAVMTWASVKSAAPGANAVQATTGALAAGDYDFDIYLAVADTVAVGKGLVLEHRNAADAATLFNLGGATPNGGAMYIQLRRYTIALNERLRVIAGTAAGAANSMYVSAIGRRSA